VGYVNDKLRPRRERNINEQKFKKTEDKYMQNKKKDKRWIFINIPEKKTKLDKIIQYIKFRYLYIGMPHVCLYKRAHKKLRISRSLNWNETFEQSKVNESKIS
jgi:hypothetical protein